MFVRDVPAGELPRGPAAAPQYVRPPHRPSGARPSSSAPLLLALGGVGLFVLLSAGVGAAVVLRRPPPRPTPLTLDPLARPTTTAPTPTASAPERDAPRAPEARVKSFRKQTSSGSTFWLVIYENSGTTTIRDPAARVSLFDGTGRRVLEQPGYAKTKQLAPGETAPILVLAMNPPAFTRAEVAVVTPRAPSTYDSAPPVVLEVVDFVPRKDNTFTKITGTVKNSSKQAVQFIEVVVTGVDASGEIVSLADGYATERQLAPGASTGFEITSGVFDVAPPTKYRVVASAMPVR
jgi:hypothetical protein